MWMRCQQLAFICLFPAFCAASKWLYISIPQWAFTSCELVHSSFFAQHFLVKYVIFSASDRHKNAESKTQPLRGAAFCFASASLLEWLCRRSSAGDVQSFNNEPRTMRASPSPPELIKTSHSSLSVRDKERSGVCGACRQWSACLVQTSSLYTAGRPPPVYHHRLHTRSQTGRRQTCVSGWRIRPAHVNMNRRSPTTRYLET